MRSNLLALFAGCIVAVYVTAQSFSPTDVAWMGQLGAASAGGGVECSGDIASSGTERFEDGEGTFCTSGWTEVDADTIMSTYSSNDYVTGEHCLETIDDGDDRSGDFARADFGSEKSTFHVRLYFKGGDCGTDNVNVEVAYINNFTTASATPEAILRYAVYSSQYQLRITAATNSASININKQTWYRVEIDHIAGSDTSSLKVYSIGGAQVGATSTYHPTTTQPRYAFFGAGGNNYTTPAGFYLRFDNITLSDSSGDIGADE